jgi:predicted dehydrogenase
VTQEQLRWGILGTGKIARIVATAVAESEGGELVAVGSRDAERAASFAADFDVPRSFGDYDGVIRTPEVDLVYVALHHPLHREWAVRAADAGKHILCEKPMAVNHAEASQIVEAARRNDVFLLEAFAYRSHPQTRRLVELLGERAIGEVRLIDAVFGYDAGPEPANYLMVHELAGGGILDVGCYTTSMAHLVAAAAHGRDAAPALQVTGAGVIGPTGVDHSAAATLTFDGGVLARVACSIQANLDSSLRVVGSEGTMTVASPWLPGLIGSEAQILVERWGSAPELIDIPLERGVYTIEVEEVNEAIRSGERSPSAMPWPESLANMNTLDRWRAAIGLQYDSEESV